MPTPGDSVVTVLLVDDEENDRAQVRNALRGRGYTVYEAESVKDGLAVFEQNRDAISLVVSDLSLPDGNGCDLALAAYRQKPGLRLLFISGHVGTEVCRYYGLEVTDLHFLRKPFSEAQLIEGVERVLKARNGFPKLAPRVRRSSNAGTEP